MSSWSTATSLSYNSTAIVSHARQLLERVELGDCLEEELQRARRVGEHGEQSPGGAALDRLNVQ